MAQTSETKTPDAWNRKQWMQSVKQLINVVKHCKIFGIDVSIVDIQL